MVGIRNRVYDGRNEVYLSLGIIRASASNTRVGGVYDNLGGSE